MTQINLFVNSLPRDLLEFTFFLIVGFTIFLVIKFINRLRTKAEDVQDATVPTPADVELLSKIKDLLEEQNKVLSKK